MDMKNLHHDRGAQDDRSTVIGKSLPVSHDDMRRALQLASAFLDALAQRCGVGEDTVITVRHEGMVLARMTLGEVLDLADAALEPEHQQQLPDDRPGGTSGA